MAEIIRSGILAINPGQAEAARALGMPPTHVMRLVVLPQAIRVAIPPTANQVINMLKVTSLVSVIGGGDLLTKAQNISSQNFYVIELLTVATLWYLALTTLATVAQSWLEHRMTPGHRRRTPRSTADPDPVTAGDTTAGAGQAVTIPAKGVHST
jgi:polar amino acid transport system permease protein